MRIEANIDYWKEGVLSFDPEKIIIRLRKFFLRTETDWKDQSRLWLERFFQIVEEKKLNPPEMIVEKKWELFSRNSPTFLFTILTETNIEVKGFVNRWRIEFKSEILLDSQTEKTIVDFLKSIEYGEIRSDTKTDNFCLPHKNFKEHWTLDDSK